MKEKAKKQILLTVLKSWEQQGQKSNFQRQKLKNQLANLRASAKNRKVYSLQCNPYQATNSILHRARTNNFTICMEIQKTSSSQSDLEKEEWNWRNQPAWLQALLQIHGHQDSMVLAQRQKYRSMEQNRKPRDKSMHIWTPYLWQRRQKYTMD